MHRNALFDPDYLQFGCAIIENGHKHIFVAEYTEDFIGNPILYKQIYIDKKCEELMADKFVHADFAAALGEDASVTEQDLESEEFIDETKVTVTDSKV